MRHKLIFGAAAVGFLVGIVAAHFMGLKKPPLPPAFKPAENPYPNGIYAEGIVENAQPSGSNVNIFPEVSGVVTRVFATDGQAVEEGAALVELDDSVPKAQVDAAGAAMHSAEANLAKQEEAYALDPRSVSRDALDTARSAAAAAEANFKAAAALRAKYTLRASSGGVVMAMNAAARSFVAPQGVYDPYTQGYDPVAVIGTSQTDFHVRCYVDEILVTRLPAAAQVKAQMAIRGTDMRVPLEFVRVRPFVSPKIELSDQRQERVDVRVLPVIFRFSKPSGINIYSGELVDVYISE